MSIFEITLFGITIAPTYYGLMYALWFLSWYYIIKYRIKNLKSNSNDLYTSILDDLLLYIVLWVILGWRLGYVLFYNFTNYIQDPISILKVWEWWMSFHWWVLGVILAMYLFSRKYKVSFLKLTDNITAVLPIWLWLGRVWNYLNWELLGFSWYTWPLAVDWRFPSPLVEALLEWLVLFIILNWVYKNKKFNWQVASLFLIFYGIFRIFVEVFFREPDSNIWYIAWYFTMWEILSLPMIIIWMYYYLKLSKYEK